MLDDSLLNEMIEIKVKSSLDATYQPSLFYYAGENSPLLVGLHTWSFDRFNQVDRMLPFARENGFSLLLPEFRGANLSTNPEHQKACGSKYAVKDVLEATNYIKENYKIDSANVFMLGLSGGGHMALLCSAKSPETFKAVGAFVPVCDLKSWALGSEHYRNHVLACCSNSEKEMIERSPSSYAKELSKVNLKIFHGKFDNIVPVCQSLELYKKILTEDKNSRVFLDIFDGGHEIDMTLASHWIISQYKKKSLEKVTG